MAVVPVTRREFGRWALKAVGAILVAHPVIHVPTKTYFLPPRHSASVNAFIEALKVVMEQAWRDMRNRMEIDYARIEALAAHVPWVYAGHRGLYPVLYHESLRDGAEGFPEDHWVPPDARDGPGGVGRAMGAAGAVRQSEVVGGANVRGESPRVLRLSGRIVL